MNSEVNRLLTHPANSELEAVVDNVLSQAIAAGGGIFERFDHAFEVAFDPLNAEKFGLSGIHSLTAFSVDQTVQTLASLDQTTWVSFAHPLVQVYADEIIDAAPIEVVSYSSSRKLEPQRILEKLAGTLHSRPQRQDIASVLPDNRVWIHSLFLLNLESFDRGQRVVHVLQDENGEFLPSAVEFLRLIEDRMLEFDLKIHPEMPQVLTQEWQANLKPEMLFKEFQSEVSGMKQEELQTAKKYFDALLKDIETRMDKLKLAPYLGGTKRKPAETKKLLESLTAKMDKVRTEREARLSAIEERYLAKFSVQPIGARILILPTFHCQIRIGDVQKSSSVGSSTATVDYCPVLREFFPPRCPNCHDRSWDVVLKGGVVICGTCASGK